MQDQVVLKDMRSTNGTFVNEEPVRARILEKKDVVRIGNAMIKVALRIR